MSSSEKFTEYKTGRAELKDLDGQPFAAECIEALVWYMYEQELRVPPTLRRSSHNASECEGWEKPIKKRTFSIVSLSEYADDDAVDIHDMTLAVNIQKDEDAPTVRGDCMHHSTEGLDFLITMASLAKMYNISALKMNAEEAVKDYQNCKMPGKLDAVIERICTTDTVTERMRKYVVSAAVSKIGLFHKSDTLDKHPEFAAEVFKKLIRQDCRRIEEDKRREAERKARQAERQRRGSIVSQVWDADG